MDLQSTNEFRYVYAGPSSPSFFGHLSSYIEEDGYDTIRITVASIRHAEVDTLRNALASHIEAGGEVTIIVGVEIMPDIEAIRALQSLAADHSQMHLELAEAADNETQFTLTTIWMESDGTHRVFMPTDRLPNSSEGSGISAFLTGEFTGHNQRGVLRELRNLWKDMYIDDTWVELFPPDQEYIDRLEPAEPDSKLQPIDHTVWPLRHDARSLLMDLTRESRGTQIQPLFDVWEHFFGVEAETSKLQAMDSEEMQIQFHLVNVESEIRELRDVVFHDHTISLELGEYRDINPEDFEDPPILIMQEITPREFAYKIVSPDAGSYDEVAKELDENKQDEYMSPQSDRRVYITDPIETPRVTLPE